MGKAYEMERRSGMDNSLQAFNLHCLIESSLLCDVLHDFKVKLGGRHIRVCFLDLVCLLLRADSRGYGVAMSKEDVQDAMGVSVW